MKRVHHVILLLCMVFVLCGCIKQEVSITLNADGSGELVLKRKIGDHEQMLKYVQQDSEKQPEFKHLSLKEIVEKADGAEWRISTYSFKKLGAALPELEHEVPMMPRFALRRGKLVVFLNRERGDNEGFKIEDKEFEDAFYNLSVTLPSKPTSEKGAIAGRTVSWSFDGNKLKAIKAMKIGSPILKAEVAAASVDADIKPRLVGEAVRELRRGGRMAASSEQVLSDYSATVPIMGKTHSQGKHGNTNVTLNYPLNGIAVPFSYSNLLVSSFVVDGKKIAATVDGKPDGVFTGSDQWGRKVSGFPVRIVFDSDNPWPRVIDAAEISLKVEEPTKTTLKQIAVTVNKLKTVQVVSESMKVAVAEVKQGSSTAAFPGASVSVVADFKQTNILAVYLDTDYGLRYKTSITRWEKKNVDRIWDAAVKECATLLKGSGNEVFVGQLGLRTIPAPPFNLVFELIEKKDIVEKKFKVEAVHVSE